MKVKVISRDKRDFTKARKSEITPVARSLAPEVHPLQRAREYKRALNAVKLDKHFSKPFIGALSGHLDGIHCLAKSPASLATLLSGSCDGELRRQFSPVIESRIIMLLASSCYADGLFSHSIVRTQPK